MKTSYLSVTSVPFVQSWFVFSQRLEGWRLIGQRHFLQQVRVKKQGFFRTEAPSDTMIFSSFPMASGLSLANKCQLLFGAAIVVLLAGVLAVPWFRSGSLVESAQQEIARKMADTQDPHDDEVLTLTVQEALESSVPFLNRAAVLIVGHHVEVLGRRPLLDRLNSMVGGPGHLRHLARKLGA